MSDETAKVIEELKRYSMKVDGVSNIAEYIRETCKGVTVFVDSAME